MFRSVDLVDGHLVAVGVGHRHACAGGLLPLWLRALGGGELTLEASDLCLEL